MSSLSVTLRTTPGILLHFERSYLIPLLHGYLPAPHSMTMPIPSALEVLQLLHHHLPTGSPPTFTTTQMVRVGKKKQRAGVGYTVQGGMCDFLFGDGTLSHIQGGNWIE
jgi:hypothetical protein